MKRSRPRSSAEEARARLADNPGAMFEQVVSREEVEDYCRFVGHVWRDRLFSPLVTLWTFLGQVLDADSSCRKAVARTLNQLWAVGRRNASHDPSAYCRARKRLPVALLKGLMGLIAEKLDGRVSTERLWCGRRVRLVDGTTVTMWDTPENQARYPQPVGQRKGCGFPMARLVGVFSLDTGALVDAVMGAMTDGETVLFHQLWRMLKAGEVLVADRHYCSYAEIVLLQRLGVDVVMRLHQSRKLDMRKGKPLGPGDRLVEWERGVRPGWMSAEDYQALPEKRVLRIVRVPLPGRTAIPVVTTLLDAVEYPAKEIARLYRRRWEIETDFDHLKTTLKMEFLLTQSPEMVEKEVWMHLLGYNLIRTLMWDAGEKQKVWALRLSLKGAVQEAMTLWPFSVRAGSKRIMKEFYEALLKAIAFHKLPERPNRQEPRVKKRRPKGYPLMTQPRQEYRSALSGHVC